jgi:hypothetical protein
MAVVVSLSVFTVTAVCWNQGLIDSTSFKKPFLAVVGFLSSIFNGDDDDSTSKGGTSSMEPKVPADTEIKIEKELAEKLESESKGKGLPKTRKLDYSTRVIDYTSPKLKDWLTFEPKSGLGSIAETTETEATGAGPSKLTNLAPSVTEAVQAERPNRFFREDSSL